jgi:translation initiation factor 2 beta subunit (eIF-2beta)/eIF-5
MDALEIVKRGQQSFVQNLSKVSKDVRRPSEMIAAYFDYEFLRPMGICGCYVDHEGNAIVAAGLERTVQVLPNALHAFIQYHVLCQKCRSSETTIVGLDVEHRATILNCVVCGTEAISPTQGCGPFFEWLQQPAHRKFWDDGDIRRLANIKDDHVFPPSDDYVSSGGWYESPRSDAADSPCAGAAAHAPAE